MVGILLASLIWWDHPNIFKPSLFPLYKEGFLMEKAKVNEG
jgi:hypothetical protein